MNTKQNNRLFLFRQNDSGGVFKKPAANVIIEAPDLASACSQTEPHFTLCDNSGLYADYDNCGCCPCCGHRWSNPWNTEGEEPSELLENVIAKGLSYFNSVATALIKTDGSIIVGNTEKNLNSIIDFVSSFTNIEQK